MDVPQIPVPRVASPRVSAPPTARDPKSITPPARPPAPDEPLYHQVLDEAARLPEFMSEALFSVVKRVNRVVFTSTPPNPPVPEQPGSWKFAAIGDYGGGRRPLTDITSNMARRNPDLILTTGDNVYWTGRERDWQRRWDPPRAFGDIRRNFPVMPSLGNHDLRGEPHAKPYFDRFPELRKARYYSFDHKGVHFVALNSNESLDPGSPQLEWLDKDLARSTSDWKVLYLHHPLYSGFPMGNGSLRGNLGPLLARHGVDLVLSGHEHSYQRSKPLNDGGTLEVITGGGGHTLHPFFARQMKHTAYRDVDFGHVEVEVTKDRLVGRYVVRDGSVRDTFSIPNLTPGQAPPADAARGARQVERAESKPVGAIRKRAEAVSSRGEPHSAATHDASSAIRR